MKKLVLKKKDGTRKPTGKTLILKKKPKVINPRKTRGSRYA